MPSPFPGMDPYLEGSHFMSFHHTFGGEILRYLAPRVGPNYFVTAEERFVLDIFEDSRFRTVGIRPDVSVAQDIVGSQGGAAVLQEAPLQLLTYMPEFIPFVTIEIRDIENHRLVTAIEILSPTNKRGEGRSEYLAKSQYILLSTAHLLEIDLLREGHRVPIRDPLPPAPYFVFLTRADRQPRTEIWPIALRDRLPIVPVPLLPGDADIPLDLQLIFTSTYDLLGGARLVDYHRPPRIPLEGDDAVWADECLRAAGLRK